MHNYNKVLFKNAIAFNHKLKFKEIFNVKLNLNNMLFCTQKLNTESTEDF